MGGVKVIPHPAGGELTGSFHPDLGWSHYRALMRVESEAARQFYESEAVRCHWNKRQLERQINTLLFERLLKSRDRQGLPSKEELRKLLQEWQEEAEKDKP
ncbi:MAG: DUF1016 N-terminal domain-containing protein [Kiritimatiellae bacterium]|nr:DUF1016 N-terminal domain-containing protein [Kiritimatiellia bacterium]